MVNYGGRILESYGASAAHESARKEMLSGYRTPLNEVGIMDVYYYFHIVTHRPY